MVFISLALKRKLTKESFKTEGLTTGKNIYSAGYKKGKRDEIVFSNKMALLIIFNFA